VLLKKVRQSLKQTTILRGWSKRLSKTKGLCQNGRFQGQKQQEMHHRLWMSLKQQARHLTKLQSCSRKEKSTILGKQHKMLKRKKLSLKKQKALFLKAFLATKPIMIQIRSFRLKMMPLSQSMQ
jgi:hypothetical protein